MLIVVLLQIFFRFVLSIGVPWTEELSRLSFIYLSFVGAAISFREKSLIRVDTIIEKARGKILTILTIFIDILTTFFIVIMFIGSLFMIGLVWPTNFATMEWMSNGWMYIATSSGFGLMIFYTIVSFLPGRKEKGNS
jgi:TRAP-type C4-dicarboxylate transport system permease small subunit